MKKWSKVEEYRAKEASKETKETGAWFDDGRVVLDKDVARFVKKHTKFLDRFSVLKMTMAALSSFAILSDENASPEELADGWKFDF